MTPERFKEVSRLYREAVELEAAERPQYLVAACAGDEALRAEVEALLSYDADSRLLDRPALELATQILLQKQTRSLSGHQVGHCQLRSLLGKGGMGEVWLAEDTQLGRQVAVKLLPAEFTTDATRVQRFTREARAASALNHPNILTIHEIGTFATEGATTHYIVTEYVEGETLRERMRSTPENRLPLTMALDLATQIAAALAITHAAGIIHRDIKPENVMVRRDGLVKVLDFGLAKLLAKDEGGGMRDESETDSQLHPSSFIPHPSTASGLVMGTPRYMSPEQARGEKVDERSDLFSLGVVIYEMVAGRPPFAGAGISEMLAAILRDAPLPLTTYAPATPPELQRIVDQALQKNREARYQTMPELLADLKQLQRQLERQEEQSDPSLRASEEEPTAIFPDAVALPTQVLTPTQSTNEQAAAQQTSFVDKLKRHKSVAALTLLLLLSALIAGVYFSPFVWREAAIDSLAVLPFVNVGANPDAEYLSDGITDGLINSLSQLPGLKKVMSRNSVFRYKGKEIDAQQAGNALGVRAVLIGKVTQRGNDLIVSAELVDVRDNSHLWGEQYNHKLSDLLAVQSQLARDISQQLRLKLSTETQQRLTKRGTESAAAHDLYLKGRYAMNALTPEEGKKALDYFRQAVEKDPRYALAYAGLAEAYAASAALGTTFAMPPKDAFEQAKAAALRAVELDDTLAEAHTSLAMIAHSYKWDWNSVEREFKRAIALNPNYVVAHHYYAHYLVLMGRLEESLTESQRALALDPLDVAMNFHLGWYYYQARQYDQAVAQLQKTLTMNQNHSGAHGILGQVYAQQGRYQEAIAELQKNTELGGIDTRGSLGYVYAIAGQRGAAQKLLAQLEEEGKHKQVSPYNIAKIYAGLGEPEQAIAWLEKAVVARDSNLTDPGLNVDVIFDRLHADPRFVALLRRMGLTL
ncbi:MAG: protein kinase domain-containing protein [Blastocatellia bacterium]